MPPLNTAEPATKALAPGGRKLAGNVGADAAVDLDIDRASGGHRAPTSPILPSAERMKAWPPKPGLTDMHQHQIDQVDHVCDRADRACPGSSETPAFLPSAPDCLQRAMQMRTGFSMHRDVIAAGLGEGLEIRIARRNHQMCVEDLPGVRTHRLDDIGAIGNVGDEMAVHDVEVDQIGAGGIDGADLFAQFGEIGGQDRRRDNEGA